jgi:hypothetical protein
MIPVISDYYRSLIVDASISDFSPLRLLLEDRLSDIP